MTYVTSEEPVSQAPSSNQCNITSHYHSIAILKVPIAEAESDFDTAENEDEDEADKEEEDEEEEKEMPSQVKCSSLTFILKTEQSII